MDEKLFYCFGFLPVNPVIAVVSSYFSFKLGH